LFKIVRILKLLSKVVK